jgi:hypothetical protein
MLRGFLAGLAAHLVPAGEGWLILSDLAEHLGLRTRDELMAAIDAAACRVWIAWTCGPCIEGVRSDATTARGARPK